MSCFDQRAFLTALDRLRAPAFWADEALWRSIADGLPSYRLSKFRPLMPDWAQRELVSANLLDVPGAQRFFSPARIDDLRETTCHSQLRAPKRPPCGRGAPAPWSRRARPGLRPALRSAWRARGDGPTLTWAELAATSTMEIPESMEN